MPISAPVLIGTLAQAGSGTSMSLNTTAACPSGSLLAVAAGWAQSPGRPFASATFGGNAMTLAGEGTSGGVWDFRHVTLYRALPSGAASGTTVVVNVSGGSLLSGMIAIAYIEGVDLNDPLADSATNTGTAAGWTTGTVDTLGDAILFGGAHHDQASSSTPSGGHVELHADLVNTNDWRFTTQYEILTGAQSGQSLGGTFSPSGNPWAASVAAFNADAPYAGNYQFMRPDADLATTGWSGAPIYNDLNDESDSTITTGTLA